MLIPPAVATVFLPRDEELGADMAAVEGLLADEVRRVKRGHGRLGACAPAAPGPPSCPLARGG